MANAQAMMASFKSELLNAYHNFTNANPARTVNTADTFKALLVKTSSTNGISSSLQNVGTPGTGTPSNTNVGTDEVTGTGYTAGGVTVAWSSPANNTTTTGYVNPSGNIVYSSVTISTPFDCVVIYNSTQGNRAVSSHTFTSQTITAGTLTLTIPANDATNALIRLA